MTNTEEINETVNDSQGLGERVRDRLPVGLVTLERRARAQWVSLPAQLRSAVDDLLGRVRNTLDLPSRGEINDLVERIEQLDAKLAELEAARAAREPAAQKAKTKGKSKSTKSGGKKKVVANKAARRDAIKQAAGRRKPS